MCAVEDASEIMC